MLYVQGRRELEEQLTGIGHDHHELVRASMHVHLDLVVSQYSISLPFGVMDRTTARTLRNRSAHLVLGEVEIPQHERAALPCSMRRGDGSG